jgi:serine/threonine-protein kinase
MSDPRPTQTAARAPAASPGDLPPGFVVGEYRIEGVAGRGGMGVVYSALQPVIEKKVAIKVLNAQLSADVDLVRRFVDEARAVNRIGHENIIDIFSFGQLADGRQYFVMEYLEGATLAARMEAGDLHNEDVPTILAQVCEALEAAHEKKIVHRDLKPENVWIALTNRGQPKVRLLDFGIAKLLETGERTVTDVGTVMGTPHYMSPEQCNGRGVDHRTDIYAMGVMMYRLFTGQLPIRGETYAEILAKQLTLTPAPPSTLAQIPAALDHLIMRCLEKEPSARPQSAAELGTALIQIFGRSGLSGPNAISAPRAASLGNVATAPVGALSGSTMPMSPPPVTAPPGAAVPRAPAAGRAGAGRLIAIVAAGIAVAAAAGWFLLRSPAPSEGVVKAPLAAPVAPPVAAPVPAAPPAPPPVEVLEPRLVVPAAPAAKAKPRTVSARPEAAAKDEAPATKPAGKKTHERAANTGLVTDNPFE